MRSATVYYKGEAAGVLTEQNDGRFIFAYREEWFNDPTRPPVSLSLPKVQLQYESTSLFPFFFNLLSEGVNRRLQSRRLRIDENDYFGLLLATARHDTIGAVTLKPFDA